MNEILKIHEEQDGEVTEKGENGEQGQVGQ